MSFSREIKDFVGAFQTGAKLWKDSEYNSARAKYYDAKTKESLAPPDPLDAKNKELKNTALEASIKLTNARTAAAGRRGSGGGDGAMSPAAAKFLRDNLGSDDEGDDGDDGEEAPAQETSALDLGEQPTTFAASGGMIDPAEQNVGEYWQGERARTEAAGEKPAQPLASLSEAVGSGLKYLQRSFGLEQDGAALPGTDPQRQQRVEAMMRGQGAPSDDEMRAVRIAVDPTGEINDGVANATAVERAYDFHKGRGDTAAAEKVSGQFLQYYRGQAAKLGALAQEALNNGNMDGAINAAVAGFNQVPNGSVASRAGDKIIVTDYKSGKEIENIPLTPSLVAQASKGLMDGSTFFTFMAQAAGKGVAPVPPTEGPIPPARPAGIDDGPIPPPRPAGIGEQQGGIAEQTSDAARRAFGQSSEPSEAVEPNERGPLQEQTQGAAEGALPGAQRSVSPVAPGAEDLPADNATNAGGAKAGALPGIARPKGIQPLIPIDKALAAGVSRKDIAQFEKINRYRAAANKAIMDEFKADRRTAATERAADRRAESQNQTQREIAARREQSQASSQAQQQHMERMRNDPAYRRDYELAEIDRDGGKAVQRAGVLDKDASDRSLSGEDMPAANAAERRGNQDTISAVPGRRLNATAKSGEKGNEYDRKDELEPALESVFSKGTADKSGKIDKASLPKTDPEIKLRMVDFMESVTRQNKISAPLAARVAFDGIYNVGDKGQQPTAVRDENGWRVQVGGRRLYMDNDTFRQLAEARGMREREIADAKKKVDASVEAKAVSERERRMSVDDADANRGRLRATPGQMMRNYRAALPVE